MEAATGQVRAACALSVDSGVRSRSPRTASPARHRLHRHSGGGAAAHLASMKRRDFLHRAGPRHHLLDRAVQTPGSKLSACRLTIFGAPLQLPAAVRDVCGGAAVAAHRVPSASACRTPAAPETCGTRDRACGLWVVGKEVPVALEQLATPPRHPAPAQGRWAAHQLAVDARPRAGGRSSGAATSPAPAISVGHGLDQGRGLRSEPCRVDPESPRRAWPPRPRAGAELLGHGGAEDRIQDGLHAHVDVGPVPRLQHLLRQREEDRCSMSMWRRSEPMWRASAQRMGKVGTRPLTLALLRSRPTAPRLADDRLMRPQQLVTRGLAAASLRLPIFSEQQASFGWWKRSGGSASCSASRRPSPRRSAGGFWLSSPPASQQVQQPRLVLCARRRGREGCRAPRVRQRKGRRVRLAEVGMPTLTVVDFLAALRAGLRTGGRRFGSQLGNRGLLCGRPVPYRRPAMIDLGVEVGDLAALERSRRNTAATRSSNTSCNLPSRLNSNWHDVFPRSGSSAPTPSSRARALRPSATRVSKSALSFLAPDGRRRASRPRSRPGTSCDDSLRSHPVELFKRQLSCSASVLLGGCSFSPPGRRS